MAKHHGHKAQVLRSIPGEYPWIGKAKTIYDLGKNEKQKWMNASFKTQQRPRNKAGRCIRAQSNRNNKEKRPAWLGLEASTMVEMAKVAKQSFHENCRSNVVSSHLKRGSFRTCVPRSRDNMRITVRLYFR
jgi:hypothetical protein